MNITRTFLGYWNSNLSPETKNQLTEKVESIKNCCDGKIFECTSNKDYNLNDVEGMLQEAIKNKCKEVVILVDSSVDNKKLEEAIKAEYKKQFENVYVIKEDFNREKLSDAVFDVSLSDFNYIYNNIINAESSIKYLLNCKVKIEKSWQMITAFYMDKKTDLLIELEKNIRIPFKDFKEKILNGTWLLKEESE